MLPTPNEDFGNPKNILDRLFGHYFKGVSTRFGLLLLENVLKKMVQNAFRVSKIFVWGGEHKLCKMITKDSSKL
jgi:hypothetical protein